MHRPWKLLLVDFREFGQGMFRCPQMLLTPIAPGPGARTGHLLLDPVAESGHQAGLGFVQDFVALFHSLNHRCHKNSEMGVVGRGGFLGGGFPFFLPTNGPVIPGPSGARKLLLVLIQGSSP